MTSREAQNTKSSPNNYQKTTTTS